MTNLHVTGLSLSREQPVNSTHKASPVASTLVYQSMPKEENSSISPTLSTIHASFMSEAIAEARAGLAEGGIPIGCVLVRHGQIVARGHNRRLQRNSVILHAEMDCLESGGRRTATFYKQCILYTTLSPCTMCSGAIRLYGIPQVVIGENKTFQGDEIILKANNVQIDILNSKECQELLENYIHKNSSIWYEDIGHDKQ